MAPEDPIMSLPGLFAADRREQKVNLGIGSYKTAQGKSMLLRSVYEAEDRILKLKSPRDYLPMEGDPLFVDKMIDLTLLKAAPRDRTYAIQTVGATCALRLAADFLYHNVTAEIAVSNPTWANHFLIFSSAGLKVSVYPYYDEKTHALDFKAMQAAISRLPPGSVVLLQTVCHNPTGADLTKAQWQELLQMLKAKKLIPFFDNAYQGFGSSIEDDAYPLKYCLENEIEMLIATSCSKNFGLYGERVGALIFVLNRPELLKPVASQLKQEVRSIYSNPAIHGARIITEILNDPELTRMWREDLVDMRDRIAETRRNLAAGLIAVTADSSYLHLEQERGFFSLLGISQKQVMHLREAFGIYMPSNGRINIAGITPQNISWVIEAFASLSKVSAEGAHE